MRRSARRHPLSLRPRRPSANAAPEWTDGTIEQSTVPNCKFFPEAGINSLSAVRGQPERRCRQVGDVFYVRMLPARVGNGCGVARWMATPRSCCPRA